MFSALTLTLTLVTTPTVAQTHFATHSPAAVSAGAFATTVVFEGGEIFVGRPGEFAFFPIPANHAGTVHVFGLDDDGDWEETADIWGWTDPETGTEYALVARMDGTAFVNLEDPANPRYLGELPPTDGTVKNLWRDIKVYAAHAFIVADGAGALQWDLERA